MSWWPVWRVLGTYSCISQCHLYDCLCHGPVQQLCASNALPGRGVPPQHTCCLQGMASGYAPFLAAAQWLPAATGSTSANVPLGPRQAGAVHHVHVLVWVRPCA
jgi:hypothetical protein